MSFGIFSGIFRFFTGGKLRLLGGSLALAVLGFFLQGGGDQAALPGDNRADGITTLSDYARDSLENQKGWQGSSGSSIQRKIEEIGRKHPTWGNAAMRLGMSFFIAMVIASLLKAFVKTMVIVLVIVGGSLFFMEQRGMIEPFWDHQMGFLIAAKDWMIAQTDSVVGFLKGYLPSSGAAATGFFVGLRK